MAVDPVRALAQPRTVPGPAAPRADGERRRHYCAPRVAVGTREPRLAALPPFGDLARVLRPVLHSGAARLGTVPDVAILSGIRVLFRILEPLVQESVSILVLVSQVNPVVEALDAGSSLKMPRA